MHCTSWNHPSWRPTLQLIPYHSCACHVTTMPCTVTSLSFTIVLQPLHIIWSLSQHVVIIIKRITPETCLPFISDILFISHFFPSPSSLFKCEATNLTHFPFCAHWKRAIRCAHFMLPTLYYRRASIIRPPAPQTHHRMASFKNPVRSARQPSHYLCLLIATISQATLGMCVARPTTWPASANDTHDTTLVWHAASRLPPSTPISRAGGSMPTCICRDRPRLQTRFGKAHIVVTARVLKFRTDLQYTYNGRIPQFEIRHYILEKTGTYKRGHQNLARIFQAQAYVHKNVCGVKMAVGGQYLLNLDDHRRISQASIWKRGVFRLDECQWHYKYSELSKSQRQFLSARLLSRSWYICVISSMRRVASSWLWLEARQEYCE